MKKFAVAVLGILLATAAVWPQEPTRLYTEPAPPSREALDRLNLKEAWHVYLPTGRRRDGIFSVQLPGHRRPTGQQVFVQLRSGAVIALDSQNGATQWHTLVGNPYVVTQALGFNSKSVFVVNGVQLVSLNRDTGVVEWDYALPHVPSAAPVADEEHVFVTLGTGQLYAFDLPKPETAAPKPAGSERRLEPAPETPMYNPTPASSYGRRPTSAFGVSGLSVSSISAVSSRGQQVRSIGALSSALQARQTEVLGPQPKILWDFISETRLESSPVLTSEYVLLAGYNGSYDVMSKFDGHAIYRLSAGPPLTAAMGSYNEVAYVASEDYNAYALDITTGRIVWRFVGGGPIFQKPAVNDKDVYIVPQRAGMYRLDRQSGQTVWRNEKAARFLAANPKFVYATDRNGRLLIIDQARGDELSVYDGARDFVVPVVNEITDRLFLASNHGLLICLRDPNYGRPLMMKTAQELKAEARRATSPGRVPAKDIGKKPEPKGGDQKMPER
jgi:outer membrane protein assembly factor BamB